VAQDDAKIGIANAFLSTQQLPKIDKVSML
jgi:hypothetical protein